MDAVMNTPADAVAEKPEKKRGEMLVMDSTGDTKIIWDCESPDEVANAERTFKDLKKKGYLAFKVDKKGDKGQAIQEFDAESERLILTPPMAGG